MEIKTFKIKILLLKVVYTPTGEIRVDLTPNKMYEVIYEANVNYIIKNDLNSSIAVEKLNFITLEKYRENQLNKIIE